MTRPHLATLPLLLGLLAAACGPAGGSAEPGSTDPAPEATAPAPKAWFEADREEHDFGDVYAAAVRETTFDLVAAGTENLVITDLKRSCGCTEGELFVLDAEGEETRFEPGRPYAPGTKFRLHASLNSRGRFGQQDQKVHIGLEGHELPATYSIKANIVNFLVQDPPQLEIEDASTLEGFSGELALESRGGERFVVDCRRDVVPEGLTIEFVPVEPDAEGRASRWTMSFAVAPGVERGIYKQKLILKTDVPNEEAAPLGNGSQPVHAGEVWIRAEVEGIFDVRPERLTFGRLRQGQAVTKKIVVRSRDPEFRMTDIEVALFEADGSALLASREAFDVTASAIDDARAWEMEISMSEVPFTGSFGGIVGIRTNHALEGEIAIPFTGTSTPAPASSAGSN